MYFFIFFKNNRNFCRVFLKYVNLEIPANLSIFFYFKPSHKLPLRISQIRKLDKNIGDIALIISTNKGLKLHHECMDLHIGGFLYLIIYT